MLKTAISFEYWHLLIIFGEFDGFAVGIKCMQSVSQNLNTQWKETDGFQQKGKHRYIFSRHDVKFEIPKGVLIPKLD